MMSKFYNKNKKIIFAYLNYMNERTSEFESFDADHTETGPEEALTRLEQIAESENI